MSSILHFIHDGGIVMYPLIAMSLAAIAIIIERAMAFRQLGRIDKALAKSVEQQARLGRRSDAVAAAERETGPLAACLATALRHADCPTAEIERRVQDVGQSYFMQLERFLPFLDTTTTIAPLLGLLGTIVGMVGTFNAIGAARGKGNTDAVLAGVGEALYATATGLTLAIVCFVAYNWFAARLRTIMSETEQAVTRLLNALDDAREGTEAPVRAD
jgi:biopolymer transport protein ExbB